MTWLREYDAIMAAWPEFRLTDVMSHEIFSGPEEGVSPPAEGVLIPPELFCSRVNKRLRNRLLVIFIGCPVMNVVLDDLIKGVSVNKLEERTSLSRYTVYKCREKVMRALQIQHYSREFIRSLKIDNSAQ